MIHLQNGGVRVLPVLLYGSYRARGLDASLDNFRFQRSDMPRKQYRWSPSHRHISTR